MNQPLFSDPESPLIPFELKPELPSIIKVIGVGGGGSNAVNHMYRQGIKGVDFLICNTDAKALTISPVPDKIQLGPSLTQGMGAGAVPEVGRQAVLESREEILRHLGEHTRMAFITAGMGGGTGTGAAPIIAGITKDRGILTVGIVTVPFVFEGSKRRKQAEAGIEEMKKNVDALLVICNDKLREMHGNLNISHAFGHADNVLAVAAKSIAEIITNTMHISTDFADIQTVMKDSGVAIMGSAAAEGDNRAIRAAEAALDSPLLNDNVIVGANYILLNITSGNVEVTMDEVGEINDYIQAQAGQSADIIMGIGRDESLGDKVSVTVIATGFHTGQKKAVEEKKPEVIVHHLLDEPVSAHSDTEPVATIDDEPVASVNPFEPVLIVRDEIRSEAAFKVEDSAVVHAVSGPVDPMEPVLIIRNDAAVPSPLEDHFRLMRSDFSSPTAHGLDYVGPFDDYPTSFGDDEESVFQASIEQENPVGFMNEITSMDAPELPMSVVDDDVFEVFRSEEDLLVIPDNDTDADIDVEAEQGLLTFEFPVASSDVEVQPEQEFEMTPMPVMKNDDSLDVVRHDLYSELPPPTPVAAPVQPVAGFTGSSQSLSPEDEMYIQSRERIMRLREISMRFQSPSGLADMEKEPAYRRRNVKLDDVTPSSESSVSRYTLSVEENRPEIRSNNSFLHDRVD